MNSTNVNDSLHETVLYDDCGSVYLTLLGDLINLMEECKSYEFHKPALIFFFFG